MTPDYTHLYRALGVHPGCSLEAFRQAYRRHVAVLHPDRVASLPGSGAAHMALSDVNALYDDAMQFHRRYGRLPGSSQQSTQDHGPRVQPAEPSAPVTAGPQATPRASIAPYVWLLLGVATVLAIVVSVSTSPDAPTGSPAANQAASAAERAPVSAATLMIGMDANAVVAIQGEPVHRRDDNWDYGPSWLRFENGRLVDWYSSPLYRLHTSTSTPPQGDN